MVALCLTIRYVPAWRRNVAGIGNGRVNVAPCSAFINSKESLFISTRAAQLHFSGILPPVIGVPPLRNISRYCEKRVLTFFNYNRFGFYFLAPLLVVYS